jgi:hypothetical protein
MSIFPTTIPTLANQPFTLTDDGLGASNDYINTLMYEHINRGGAPIKIYKLMGLKEREIGISQSLTYITSKNLPMYESVNAIGNISGRYYKSFEKGVNIVGETFIGIDCGYIKLQNQRKYYSNDASYMIEVRSLIIKQDTTQLSRCLKVRIERSDDNISWKGVEIVSLDNNDIEKQYYIKASVPSRYWRIRPIQFNGGLDDRWILRKCVFSTKSNTTITNINLDHGILENRMRSYSQTPITIKAVYDPKDIDTEFNGFGLFQMNKQDVTIHFDSTVASLSRPIVIGDIIEFPFEGQYDTEMNMVKKMMEVTDVAWSTQGYTPGYKPLLQRVMLEPLTASEENKDVTKNLRDIIGTDLFPNSSVKQYLGIQPTETITDNIVNQSKMKVPQNGLNNQELSDLVTAPSSLMESDSLPSEGQPYTEGYTLPDKKDSQDGQYFRLIYKDLDIPAQLYKFSCSKKRWIFMEEDLRTYEDVAHPPTVQTLIKGKSPR